jgi:HD-GYP domain-containing protein (c-di-GMP phosphodiesterase class II)
MLGKPEVLDSERDPREDLARADRERDELNRIGIALSSTRDIGTLLEMILSKAREITNADAGSLYLVESSEINGGSSGQREQRLRFKFTQNASRQFPFNEGTMPLTQDSMAGYTALHGEVVALDDVYAIPPDRPYRFNPRFDQETGYRTRSLLTLPMKNPRGEVIGVVQLLNCKRNWEVRLASPEDFEREVQPFSPRSVHLAESLASQAAVAYENSRLYHDIERLFEGFVRASVTAIEQRDPTTSGHSTRVATMTVGLAEAINRIARGPYAQTRFTPEQLKEIRYAALLHDFGKVAVREEVLVKAKKLHPSEITVLHHRFDYVRKEMEAECAQKKLEAVLARGAQAARGELARIDEEYRRKQVELDESLRFILVLNEPTVLRGGSFEKLVDVARQTYRDPRGRECPLLTPDEVSSLSIPQGSLNDDERRQIESHVTHSFNFLIQIPWTPEIKYIPWIARAHHEKLNGTGYPNRLRGDEIPVQAKMMSICDIFDALSAADRPYKKAVSIERALDILDMSVRDRELDSELFQIFQEARIYELTSSQSPAAALVI